VAVAVAEVVVALADVAAEVVEQYLVPKVVVVVVVVVVVDVADAYLYRQVQA